MCVCLCVFVFIPSPLREGSTLLGDQGFNYFYANLKRIQHKELKARRKPTLNMCGLRMAQHKPLEGINQKQCTAVWCMDLVKVYWYTVETWLTPYFSCLYLPPPFIWKQYSREILTQSWQALDVAAVRDRQTLPPKKLSSGYGATLNHLFFKVWLTFTPVWSFKLP